MSSSTFGTMPDGETVTRTVISGHGLTASIVSFGARVQDLRLDGVPHSLVLGFPEFEPYLTEGKHFGAIAGRFANRINQGRAPINGETVQLDRNFMGKHLLHGGAKGTATKNWTVSATTPDSVTLTLSLPDGEMGFPGNLDLSLTYRILAGPSLQMVFAGKTDKPTLCNLAQHSYFNLDGSGDIRNHELTILARGYTVVDADAIPTGETAPVAGSIFDFRNPVRLDDPEVLETLDHNFVIADARLAHPVLAARLSGGGITMEIRSTEPGLQAYAGAKLHERATGLGGFAYGPNAGIALESQLWPDAPNHADFPSALLMPDTEYHQETLLDFRRS
ncbi:aldose epimerase family protein [Paracoccus cavernae]|uniref:aldose epimerase family protein n=1 Tax=Paracoccus cavernae TaxID=1571207 RepID=UPI0035F2A6F8